MNGIREESSFLLQNAFPFLAIAAVACGPAPENRAEQTIEAEATGVELQVERAPAYLDVEETFTSEDDQNRWFDLERGLAQDFDDICGDTFCEGEFTNLQSMAFRCSVAGAHRADRNVPLAVRGQHRVGHALDGKRATDGQVLFLHIHR